MSIAEIIYTHSRRLPDQAAREALSYIEFLEQRYGVRSPAEVKAVTGPKTYPFPVFGSQDDPDRRGWPVRQNAVPYHALMLC